MFRTLAVSYELGFLFLPAEYRCGRIAQLVRAPALHAGGHRFESCFAHQTSFVWLVFLRVFVKIASLGFKPGTLFRVGGVAQLGEHFHGMEGVVGSIPIASTNF